MHIGTIDRGKINPPKRQLFFDLTRLVVPSRPMEKTQAKVGFVPLAKWRFKM